MKTSISLILLALLAAPAHAEERVLITCLDSESGESATLVFNPETKTTTLQMLTCTFNNEVQRSFCGNAEYPVWAKDSVHYVGEKASWESSANGGVAVQIRLGSNWWNQFKYSFTAEECRAP